MGICTSQLSSWVLAPAFTKLYELDDKAVIAERPNVTICKARHRASGELVAVKRIDKLRATSSSKEQQQQSTHLALPSGYCWQNELAVIKRCARHPNVVEFKQTFETRDHALVVMEFVAGGELFDALISDGAYSEWDARRFVKDSLEALQFLHERGIIHRDIKPENLLFTSSDSKTASIKVVNFAMAKLVDEPRTRVSAAASHEQLTWPYCAPEILATIGGFASRVESIRTARVSANAIGKQQEATSIDTTTSSESQRPRSASVPVSQPSPPIPTPEVSTKCDVWSVGIVLYVLLSGAHPFDLDGRQTRDQIVQNILLGHFSMSDESSVWRAISREAKDLLACLLELDPSKRPSATEALAHDWFSCPHTPRATLSVSVEDGLGQYQRLMRRKFRTSVLVAMATETFRRSLKKHQEAAAAAAAAVAAVAAEGASAASCPLDSMTTQPSSVVPASDTVASSGVNALPYATADGVRAAECTEYAGKAAPLSPSKQGSVLSRVFSKQPTQDIDAPPDAAATYTATATTLDDIHILEMASAAACEPVQSATPSTAAAAAVAIR